tara:strand:- start:560 stop:775 length:216 start_codon:yes stop_codon:yes gene_type:complete
MKYPKDPVDATIVAFLWAEWFVKKCLWIPYHLFEKYDYWSHNKAVEQAARDAEENPPVLPDINNESTEDPS